MKVFLNSEKGMFEKFILLCLFFVPLLLSVAYDYSFVTYDSEPDYIAAAFHIDQFGIPFSSHHPGSITQYLISIPLVIGNYFNLSFNFLIIFVRFFELLILSTLIFYGIHLMSLGSLKAKLFYYSLVWLFIFLYPSSSVLFKFISAEILLFGISFLTCVIWFKHFEFKDNTLLIPLLIAAGMNIKPTFIFLLFVLSFFHIVIYAYASKTLRGLISLIRIIGFSTIFFTIFSIPKFFQIMSIMRNLIEDWMQLINSILNAFDLYLIILVGVACCLPILLFYSLKNQEVLSESKSNILNQSIAEGWIIFVPVLLFVFYKLFFYLVHPEIDYLMGLGQWESLGIMRRNSIPLYAFLVFFIVRQVIKKTRKINNLRLTFTTVLFFIAGVFLSTVTSSKPLLFFDRDISLFDQTLMDLIEIEPEAKIYIHHDNYFDSVIQFYLWTTIRYGNCNYQGLQRSLQASYPELMFDNFSYASTRGITKCNSSLPSKENAFSFNRWLNVPIKVEKLDLCTEFDSEINNKIFLLDSRYIDEISTEVIVNRLNLKIKTCGFKMTINNNYFINKEIHAYDIIKS